MNKSCIKCFEIKDLNEFHILKKGLYGRNSTCKKCRSEFRFKRKTTNTINEKLCITCNKIYKNNFFYKNKCSLDGLQSYCKECHKKKISESNSKLDSFSKIMLNKFKKKHNDLEINLNVIDIKNKYIQQKGLCFISNKKLTHVSDMKQRIDNVWNMAIYIIDKDKEVNYDNFNLVIHMIYTIKELYKLNDLDVKIMYKNFIN
jgi:hypothetical protein